MVSQASEARRRRDRRRGQLAAESEPATEDLPSLSGAAFLAIRAQVPLVPIALSGVYDLLPIHTSHFHPTDMKMMVGEPLDTTGLTTRQTDELTARLRDAIAGMLECGC